MATAEAAQAAHRWRLLDNGLLLVYLPTVGMTRRWCGS